MSGPLLDSGSGRLVPVPDGGPVGADMLGVPASVRTEHALLSVQTDELVRVAVRLSPLAEVPDGVVAIGRGLAGRLGVGVGETHWRLDAMTPVDIRRLRIELPTEDSIDTAVAGLVAAGLPGRVLWCSAQQEPWLDVEEVPHRVRALDVGGQSEVVGRITERTEIEVFAAGVRSGVDIVILADCSGSMGVTDIEPYGEGVGGWSGRRGGHGNISRTQALRQALYDLLDVRLKIDGRVSRVALVAFTEKAAVRFPRTGDMVELDGSSPPALIKDFRDAITLLSAQDGHGTDIGNALHEAANLLYYSGRPDNEKLVVLVSDGAHWTPRGDQGTGEVVRASEEPVSLMAHLHHNTGIRLHAIGISTPELYRRWLAAHRFDFNHLLNPNHDLLEQLVEVGGGDPTTIGGLDVLAEYFSGLGAGITRTVRLDRSAVRRPGRLPAETAEILARLGTVAADGVTARRARLASELAELAGQCNTEAERVFSTLLLDSAKAMKAAQRSIENSGSGDRAFVRFARDMVAFKPGRPPEGAGRTVLDRHADLVRYIDGLRGAADRDTVDLASLSTLVGGTPLRDAGAAIDVSAQRLLALLRDWYEALRAERPVRPTVPESRPGPQPAFALRDISDGRDDDVSGTTGTGAAPAAPGGFVFRD